MKNLAERVKRLRIDLNMSQRELSDVIKSHRKEISGGQGLIQAIESGRTKHPTCIWELSLALETSVEYLMTGEISTNSSNKELIREINRLKELNKNLQQTLKNLL